MRRHYPAFSFLIIYAIYPLILAGFQNLLLLLEYLRLYDTAMHWLYSPSLLSFTSWLCPQTDQELSLQLSVSFSYIAVAVVHGLLAGLDSETR